ncbi:hypothetical protein [Herbaspirillum sp.]|uniref:hypothetical protein n=1 Tax=Herbaspirillum TaxID=963 RepID=UPI000C0B8CB2|nr:hypothetical protein [Herbaspirillum sp.]MAF05589.1 hypothetical protein [Herbaspirillum sp.]MBO17781.1 hypothetical protein [Herbaspirillum sp.]|tara:strand:- start:727 stop:1281 length:555 start_codon:yes stop_codon:yes gene_type:complete
MKTAALLASPISETYTRVVSSKKLGDGIGVPESNGAQPPEALSRGFLFCHARSMVPTMGGRAGGRKARRFRSSGTPTCTCPPTPIGVGKAVLKPNERSLAMIGTHTGKSAPKRVIPDTISLPTVQLLELRDQIAGAHLALAGLAALLCRSEDDVEHGAGMMLRYVTTALEQCDSNLFDLTTHGS